MLNYAVKGFHLDFMILGPIFVEVGNLNLVILK